MTVIGFPRDTDFFQGLDLSLVCDIYLSSAVDSPVTVQSSWQRNETHLGNNRDDQITVTNTTVALTSSNYQTLLRLNPVDLDDGGTYACVVTITPQNSTFITGTTASAIKNITDISSESWYYHSLMDLQVIILCYIDFPSQNVTLIEEGLSTAGYSNYTLLCTTTREQHLSSLTAISVQWLGPNGSEISGDKFNIVTEGSENGAVLISRLIFNNLLTSQAGDYTCRTALTIPGTDILNYTVNATFTLAVKCKLVMKVRYKLTKVDAMYTVLQYQHLRQLLFFKVAKLLSMKALVFLFSVILLSM